jgi:hypothetical protein
MSEKELQDEDLIERIEEDGRVAFSLSWDSDNPGMGADAEVVYEFEGRFYYLSNSVGSYGPYESLDAALDEHELIRISSATREIECDSMPAEQILARSRIDDDVRAGSVVRVKGQDWIRQGTGRFEPV